MPLPKELPVEDILRLYNNRLIGFREARSLVEAVSPMFATVRDTDLDDLTDAIEHDNGLPTPQEVEEEPPEPSGDDVIGSNVAQKRFGQGAEKRESWLCVCEHMNPRYTKVCLMCGIDKELAEEAYDLPYGR